MLYLLHATVPVNATGTHSAQHYLGFSPNPSTLARRVRLHRAGRGSHLTMAMSRLPGQALLLVSVWEGGQEEERLLKNRHQLWVACPVCNPRALIGSVTTPLPPPRRAAYKLPSPKPASTIGGASPASSKTRGVGWSPAAPPPERDMW